MNYNPYQPPAAPVGMGPIGPAQGPAQPWEVGESISAAWQIYKTHWAPLTLGVFVTTLIGGVPGQIAPLLAQAGVLDMQSTTYQLVNAPLAILGQIVAQFFAAGMCRAAIRASRDNNVTFGDFFSAGAQFFPFLGMAILRFFAVVFGLVLLVVPGVILSLGFINADFYVIDQNLGPIEAMKASWASTDGQKGNLFVFALAELGITLLGLVACCLGIFVAIPVCLLARGIIYMRMSGTVGNGPSFGGMGGVVNAGPGGMVGVPGGGFAPPQGGFGPPPGGMGGPPGYGGPPPGGGYGGPPGY